MAMQYSLTWTNEGLPRAFNSLLGYSYLLDSDSTTVIIITFTHIHPVIHFCNGFFILLVNSLASMQALTFS